MSYIFIQLYLCLLSFLELVNKKINILIKIGILILILFSAFRYKTGLDWFNYMTTYNSFQDITIELKDNGNSKGYILLVYIFKEIGVSYEIFQFILSVFPIIFIFKFFNKFSKYPMTSMYLYYVQYYLTYNMGVQKQMLALTFFILFYFKYIDNKKKQAVVFISLAFLIHFSAIIFLLIILCDKINIKRQKIYILLSFLFIGIYIIDFNIIKVLDVLKNYNLGIVSAKINHYLANENYSGKLNVGIFIIIENILIIIVYKIKKPKDILEKKIYNYIIIFQLLKVLSFNFYVFYRFVVYFGIFQCVFIVKILDIIKQKKIKILLNLLLLSYYSVFFLQIILIQETRAHKRYVPYYNIFNRINTIERLNAEKGE